MSLDGLRAWVGEVERKLRMRTRVFLVLAVIAVGGAGAAIYLAVEAKNDSVSESDVQALQEELEARIDESATTPAPILPEAEPTPPEGKGATGKGGTGASGAGQPKPEGDDREEGSSAPPSTGSGSSSPPQEHSGQAKKGSGKKGIGELLEQAKKKNERIEREEGKGR